MRIEIETANNTDTHTHRDAKQKAKYGNTNKNWETIATM